MANYNSIDNNGNLGKYGFSPQQLINLGYVKPTTARTLAGVENPNNWSGLNGVNSATEFRLNGPIQELAMYDITRQNYSQLQNAGLIDADTTKSEIAGLLNACHRSSVEEVTEWARTGRDLSGTNRLSIFYNQGQYSQTQVSLLEVSDASKEVTGSGLLTGSTDTTASFDL